MIGDLTRAAAIELETILKNYAVDHADSRTVLYGLQPLIDTAKNGEFNSPISVPFGYALLEGLIILPKDADAAYSKFSLLLELGEERYFELIKWANEQKRKIFDKG